MKLAKFICALIITLALAHYARAETLISIGDSVTGAPQLLEEERYPSIVGRELGWGVVNLAISGSTSRYWAHTSIPETDVLTVLVGAGDVMTVLWPWLKIACPISAEEYAGNLFNILDLNSGSKIILITPIPSYNRHPLMGEWRDVVFRVGAAFPSVRVIDTWEFMVWPDDFERDQLHPNAQGVAKIAKAVLKVIRDKHWKDSKVRHRGLQ